MRLQDKDGFLSSEDLHKALGRSEDVKQLIAAADANGDGEAPRLSAVNSETGNSSEFRCAESPGAELRNLGL